MKHSKITPINMGPLYGWTTSVVLSPCGVQQQRKSAPGTIQVTR